ncbi:MAG: hypothetical protein R3208_21550 [Ketobacteraceae bacterium]|nr:hypothetical protein [Ketobacteraceae bacterium]
MNKESGRRWNNNIWLICIALLCFGCASNKAVVKRYDTARQDQFLPVNMNINGGQILTVGHASVVHFLGRTIINSNQFRDVEVSYLRYPYSLEIEHGWATRTGPVSLISLLVSAGSVLIIPGYMNETHTMNVRVLYNDTLIESLQYTHETKAILSLWHLSDDNRKAVAGEMVQEFLADLRERKLIPTMGDLNRPAPVMDKAI